MIIVKMQGGLGNQISQYAFYRLLSYKYPKTIIKVDKSWYKNAPRDYELDKVFDASKMKIDYSSEEDIKLFPFSYVEKRNKISFLSWIILKIKETLKRENVIYIQNCNNGYREPKELYKLDIRKNWYLDGTWHNVDYTEIIDTLKKELVCVCPVQLNAIKEQIESKNSVFIHMRLGDYENTQWDILRNSSYYAKAIDVIKKEVENPYFYVFSNDCDKARTYFSKQEFSYVDSEKDLLIYDFALMSMCKYAICANSTYSYWASLLGKNKVIIIFPKHYTKDKLSWNNSKLTKVEL